MIDFRNFLDKFIISAAKQIHSNSLKTSVILYYILCIYTSPSPNFRTAIRFRSIRFLSSFLLDTQIYTHKISLLEAFLLDGTV